MTLKVSSVATLSRIGVIDEQARQVEQPRHPSDDGDDMQCFQDLIGIAHQPRESRQ